MPRLKKATATKPTAKTTVKKTVTKKPAVKKVEAKTETVEKIVTPVTAVKKAPAKKAQLVKPAPKFTAENHPNRRLSDRDEDETNVERVEEKQLPVINDEDVKEPLLRKEPHGSRVKLLSMDEMFSLMAHNAGKTQSTENRFQKFLKR